MSDDRQVFSVAPGRNGSQLALVGELDSATVPELVDALSTLNGERDVKLDLAGLTFIDSSGLHAIVAYARSREPDGTVTLCDVSRDIVRIFEITHLTELRSLRIRGRA